MKYVNFFGHQTSKLIVGDNPMNGYSYIGHRIPGSEMVSFYTAEKFKETLFRMEELGYKTMLPLADPYVIRLLKEYRRDGGKLQFIFQPFRAMDQDVSIRQMMEVEPIGIYHQGTTTDDLFEAGQCEKILSLVEKYKTMGIPVGLGTHRPDVVEKSEKEGWPVDFYVACLQNPRIDRTGVPGGYLPADTLPGWVFYPEDRPRMLSVLSKVEKPVIAYKIFAGGQMFENLNSQEKQHKILDTYQEVFSCLKPNDMAAIGVFQRDMDQLEENAALFDRWAESANSALFDRWAESANL